MPLYEIEKIELVVELNNEFKLKKREVKFLISNSQGR